jgi:hypothetical protein
MISAEKQYACLVREGRDLDVPGAVIEIEQLAEGAQ